ncbi:MAG: hypothetical protein OZ921_19145 [Sorangiineae bacterium]|nr:hypothetical protein [Polyangiaceae bacterium]MEB2324640.1 hypothetical protein [Sorangiineae bacterium]
MTPVTQRTCKLAVAALACAAAWLAPSSAQADDPHQSGKFGLGAVVGYPGLGVSMNYFLSSGSSLQLDPVLYLRDSGGHGDAHVGFGGRVDYLFWPSKLHSWSSTDLVWFFGPGANLYLGNGGFGLGAELPVGLGLTFNKASIDLNVEGVPVLHVLDDDGVNLAFGIGGALNARYYF